MLNPKEVAVLNPLAAITMSASSPSTVSLADQVFAAYLNTIPYWRIDAVCRYWREMTQSTLSSI